MTHWGGQSWGERGCGSSGCGLLCCGRKKTHHLLELNLSRILNRISSEVTLEKQQQTMKVFFPFDAHHSDIRTSVKASLDSAFEGGRSPENRFHGKVKGEGREKRRFWLTRPPMSSTQGEQSYREFSNKGSTSSSLNKTHHRVQKFNGT